MEIGAFIEVAGFVVISENKWGNNVDNDHFITSDHLQTKKKKKKSDSQINVNVLSNQSPPDDLHPKLYALLLLANWESAVENGFMVLVSMAW